MISLLVWHPAKTKFLWGEEDSHDRAVVAQVLGNAAGREQQLAFTQRHRTQLPGKWSHKICIPVSYPEGCSRFCLNVHQEENELQVSISPRENLFSEILQLMKWGSINSSIITMRALALCPALPLTLFTLITSGLP